MGCTIIQDPLPQAWVDRLRERFTPRRVAYIARSLTAAELAVVADLADALIIARIKRMDDARLHRFERLRPAGHEDQRMFSTMQVRWLRDEEYLIGTRLGRKPEHRELFSDFMRNHNGLRFRAYFALKYPKRVVPTKPRKSN
jgi:hypothetical protein